MNDNFYKIIVGALFIGIICYFLDLIWWWAAFLGVIISLVLIIAFIIFCAVSISEFFKHKRDKDKP